MAEDGRVDNHLPNLLNDSDSFEGVGDINTNFKPHQGISLAFNLLRVQIDFSRVKCACESIHDVKE